MSDAPALTPDTLAEITGIVRLRLRLPYAIQAITSDPIFIAFNFFKPGHQLRATAFVPQTGDLTRESLLADLIREAHAALGLCPLCAAEGGYKQFATSVEVRCGTCGHYTIDVKLAREFAQARATEDTTLLGSAARLSQKLRGQRGPVDLTTEVIARLLAEDRI